MWDPHPRPGSLTRLRDLDLGRCAWAWCVNRRIGSAVGATFAVAVVVCVKVEMSKRLQGRERIIQTLYPRRVVEVVGDLV